MTTKRAVFVESGALLALGAIGAWGGLVSYLRADTRTQSSSMQPGVYVLAISVALIVTAFAYAWFALRAAPPRSGASAHAPPQAFTSGIVVMVFGVIALYGWLIPLIGYLPATVLFLLAEFRLLGVDSWSKNALLTIVASAAFYLVFVRYGEMAFPHPALFD